MRGWWRQRASEGAAAVAHAAETAPDRPQTLSSPREVVFMMGSRGMCVGGGEWMVEGLAVAGSFSRMEGLNCLVGGRWGVRGVVRCIVAIRVLI